MGYAKSMPADDELQTSFTRMVDATPEDYHVIARHSLGFQQGLPDRILQHLALLGGDTGGYAVDRLTHSLQTATRAQRAGRDEEYVVCALVHDIGDTLASLNHSALAAVIVEALRLRGESLDRAASRHLPGLLLLPSPRARPEHAGPLPRSSLRQGMRGVLRRLRPEQLRSGLRHAAARALRANGATRVQHSQAILVPAERPIVCILMPCPIGVPPARGGRGPVARRYAMEEP